MPLPTSAQLDSAAETVYAAMQPTAHHAWPLLDAALGARAWIKHENHNPIGAFKVRGGLVYMANLRRRAPEVRAVVTATRGNHGLSVAFAARRHGLQAHIVVPEGNNVEKAEAIRALGAQVIVHGADFNHSLDHARLLAEREGMHMISSFHPDLLAGVATYWMELLRAKPELDLLIVPVGQGSGICGAIAAREALGHHARIVGVVSTHAPAWQLSFQARRSVEAPAATVLNDGVACRVPHPESLAIVLDYVDEVIDVSDAEVAAAMRLYYRCTHNLAEGAGAAALAAALQRKDSELIRGRTIGLPLSGGNVDAALFLRVLQGEFE